MKLTKVQKLQALHRKATSSLTKFLTESYKDWIHLCGKYMTV